MSSVKVIGFNAVNFLSSEPMPSLDFVIEEDTRAMGQQAIELIHTRMLGQSVPATVYLHPKLITRDNINTQEVQQMLSTDFTLGRWRWSSIQ
jgi:DNA-binding LacI/PurR family transcriptional regulator